MQAQRERIIATRDERRMQLERRIEENKKKIEDHYSGISILSDSSLQHLIRRNEALIHQVQQMSKELDEEVWLELRIVSMLTWFCCTDSLSLTGRFCDLQQEIQRKIEAVEKRRLYLEERRKYEEL